MGSERGTVYCCLETSADEETYAYVQYWGTEMSHTNQVAGKYQSRKRQQHTRVPFISTTGTSVCKHVCVSVYEYGSVSVCKSESQCMR